MRLPNGAYDKIKWFALAFIPALEVLILTVGKIWGLPYYDNIAANIAATIAAVGVFLAAIIGVSSKTYYEELAAPSEEDYLQLIDDETEGGDEDDPVLG